MNQHFFGAGAGEVPVQTELTLRKIARKHDAVFIAAIMPEGPRYWFYRSHDMNDHKVAAQVLREARTAGVWPVKAVRRKETR